MEKDFDIEIQDSHDENEAHVQLPMNFLAFGEIEPDDVKVYIKQDVYRALEKYALVHSFNASSEIPPETFSQDIAYCRHCNSRSSRIA